MKTSLHVIYGISIAALLAALSLRTGAMPTPKKQTPTFTKDIAPIVFNHCATCHRPGEVAPFSLLTYTDAKKWGEQIVEVTKSRTMPPWKPGPSDHAFQDDNHLTEAQITSLRLWVAGGMKEGDPSDMPKVPTFTPGWQLGEPDMIIKMPTAFPVPADGRDIYRNFVLPMHLPNDVYIRAIDFHPSARSVVHHSLFFADTTGQLKEKYGKDGKPGYEGGMGGIVNVDTKNIGAMLRRLQQSKGERQAPGNRQNSSLGGWAAGAQPLALPDGLAYFVPKGSDFILSTHFHPSGKPEKEQSVVGLYFSKMPPKQDFTAMQFPPLFGVFTGLKIPAGAKTYTIKDSFTLPVDVKAFGIGGHAHYLAKTMKLTATLPSGTRETLLWIPDWDFNWQGQYQFEKFVDLPKGTRLDAELTYDNSADNPHNPSSPPKAVAWGEQSTDEMGSLILRLVATKETDLPTLKDAYRNHLRDAFRKNPPFSLFGR
jgi:mono/diheme cytochrome c family protein